MVSTAVCVHVSFDLYSGKGFAGRSLCKILNRLGITGVAKKRAIQSAREAAERATRWLWIKRTDLWMVVAGTQVGA